VPNRDRAEVPLAKVTHYLLNPAHPDGAPKAAFFTAMGFNRANPSRLIDALLAHIRDNPAVEVQQAPFGALYVLDAALPTPDGRAPIVRSVWIIEPRFDYPRLVTAYPAPSHSGPRPKSD
jgi:hypothetical protein